MADATLGSLALDDPAFAATTQFGENGDLSSGRLPEYHKPEDLAKALKENFYLQLQWDVPVPRVPSAPLLYIPKSVSSAFKFPAREVQAADLDAMALGVLESIPVVPYLTQPDDVRAMRDFVAETEDAWKAHLQERQEKGLGEPLVVDPRDRNPALTDDDYALIDVDFDEDPLSRRDLPSLALLQKPLYTEMNEIPKEVRAAARAERARERAGVEVTPGGGRRGSMRLTQGATPGPTQTAADLVDPRTAYLEKTEKTFKNSLQLDADFGKFLKQVAVARLGVVGGQEDNGALLARILFRILASVDGPTKRSIWTAVRAIATSDSAAIPAQLTADVSAAVAGKGAELEERLSKWTEFYTTALKGVDVAARLAAAGDADEHEMDFQGGFRPASKVARADKLKQPDSSSQPVPLAVLPVYPSGFDAAVGNASQLEDPYASLAARGSDLSHLVFANQQPLGKDAGAMPHVVFESKLGDEAQAALLNPQQDALTKKNAPESGATGVYNLQVVNQFTPHAVEPVSTSSYMLKVDEQVATYDRIGRRTFYARNTGRRVLERSGSFVMSWENPDEFQERRAEATNGLHAEQANEKRARDEEEQQAADDNEELLTKRSRQESVAADQ